MTEPVQQRAPGWYRRSLVLGLVMLLSVAVVNGASWLRQSGSRPEAVAVGPSRSAPTHGEAQSGAPVSPSTAAVDELLQHRSEAVIAADRAQWLATVDPGSPALVLRQAELFDRVAGLRAAVWTYSLLAPDATLPAATQAALGASAFLAHVRLTYRLATGAGEIDRDQHLTLVWRGRWLVGGTDDGAQQKDLWDLGPVTVSRGSRSIVVSARAAPLSAQRTASEADRAAERVDAVWGAAWPRIVVIMVPGSLADMAAVLDRASPDGLSQLAAVTTGELRTAGTGVVRGGRTTGDRVVINPVAFPGLTATGRVVVLTHEFTHVATRASAVRAPPVWVDEGFADYVAYLGTPLTAREIAGDLLDSLQAVAALGSLPDDGAFDPAAGRIGRAYAEAWLAMHFVEGEGGPPMVVDFYRVAVGLRPLHSWPSAPPVRASLTPRTPLEHACVEVLGYVEPSFVRRWLVFVREQRAAA
ncbi:MAG TPA: hypothetical protein VMT69_04165 [Kineosporiaceae bacterium]|nr:hypothetical protein [Kineosporiaceae bacterium]